MPAGMVPRTPATFALAIDVLTYRAFGLLSYSNVLLSRLAREKATTLGLRLLPRVPQMDQAVGVLPGLMDLLPTGCLNITLSPLTNGGGVAPPVKCAFNP